MDPIPGTTVDDILLAAAVIATALTAIAAAARQPPLRWLGRWVAFVARRLIGDPVATWLAHQTEEQVRPLVREETAAVLAAHMAEEETALRDVGVQLTALSGDLHDHVEEDRAGFAAARHLAEEIKSKVDLRVD